MSYVKMTEVFGELVDAEVKTIHEYNFLRKMLVEFSEGLFNGVEEPITIPTARMEDDIDFWGPIRCGYVSPREITKMIWQAVYEFKHPRDFDQWLASWPIEAQNFAIASVIWKHFKNEQITFSGAVGLAREYMMRHSREAIMELLIGCKKAVRVTGADRDHPWMLRRRVMLYRNGKHKSWSRMQWHYMSQMKEYTNEFVSAWEDVPLNEPHGPQEEPRIVEEPGRWAKFVGWTSEMFTRLFWRQAEMQMDEDNRPIPSKQKLKMMNMIRSFLTVMERHHEKMLVLCKIGRFRLNLGADDLLLYRRQSRIIGNAAQTFLFGRDANFPSYECFNSKGMPWRYSDESEWCKEKLNKWLQKMLDNTDFCILSKAFRKCVGLVRILQVRWARPFDPERTRPIVHEEAEENLDVDLASMRLAEMQSDEAPAEEKPVLKSGAKTVAKASAPAKKKEYKNVKKSKASGSITKVDETKKETKVNLTMADTRSIQKETVKKQVSKPKPESNPEKNNSMDDVMKRPMMIARYNWNAASGTKQLAQFILPQAYFSHADKQAGKVCQPLTAAHMMTQYGFTRFDIKVKAQINSNKFQRGLVLIWWQPFYTSERDNIITWQSKTNFPHVWVDASSSNSIEMLIPWTNIRDYFPLYTDSHTEYNYWGTLHVDVWNEIATGANSSADASITFYMNLENWELHQQVNPKPVDTVNFATEIMADDLPHLMMKERPAMMTRLVGKRIPVVDGFTPSLSTIKEVEMQMNVATGLLAVAGAHVMEGLMDKVSRVSADKPIGPKSAGKVKLEAVAPTVHGDGAEAIPSLSLTQARTTPMREKFLDTVAPSNLRELIEKESWLDTITVTTSNTEGESLVAFTVSPSVQKVSEKRSVTCWARGERFDQEEDKFTERVEAKKIWVADAKPTMLAYLANGFLRWTGDIQFHAIAAKTSLHTLRVGWRYEPTGTTKTAAMECQKIATPGLIWDLNENNEIKFTAPYVAPQPFLSTDYKAFSYQADTPQVMGNYACGIIELYIVNPMKVSTGVAQSIEINIFVSGAPSFEFSGLSSMSPIQCIGTNPLQPSARQAAPLNYYDMHYGIWLITLLTHEVPNKAKGNKQVATRAPNPIGGGDKQIDLFTWTNRMIELYAAADAAAEVMLEIEGFDKKKVTSKVSKPVWRKETAKTYEAAAHFLIANRVEIPKDLVNALTPDEQIMWKKWMVIAHMRGYYVGLNEVPSWTDFVVKIDNKTPIEFIKSKNPDGIVEMQMAEEEAADDTITNKPTPKEEGINPFKDGTTTDIVSVKELIGEDFNDMYKICRRYYPGEILLAPEVSGSPFEKQLFEEQFMATCNNVEEKLTWWEFHFPVHPFIPFKANCVDDAFTSKKELAKFTSQWDFPRVFGTDCRHDTTYNQQHLFCWLYTFWRGEIREKIVLESDSTEPLIGYAVHRPASYEEAGVRLASHAMMRRAMNYGAVVYRGNVMGSFEFEIPWNQKYSRLLLSNSRRSAITDNGTISIYVPVQRKTAQYRGQTPPVENGRDSQVGILKQLMMTHFRAWGDNTELLIPRGAPIVSYYPTFTENTSTDNWVDQPVDYPTGLVNRKGSVLTAADLERGVQKHVQSYQVEGDPTGSYLREVDRIVPWPESSITAHSVYPGNDDTMKALNEAMVRIERHDFRDVGKVNKPTVEMQADEEAIERSNEGPMRQAVNILAIAKTCATFDEFKAKTDGMTNGSMLDAGIDEADGVVQSLVYGVGKLPAVVDMLNTNLEKMGKTWSLTDKAFETWQNVSQKLGSTSDVVRTASSFAFDASRVGIVMYAFWQLLTAETWQAKMMAITTGALALGLSIELVKTVGQWLMSNIGGLFMSREVIQTVETQSDEDHEQTIWEMVVENQDSFKMFAAGAGALAVFYMTQREPCTTKTVAFAGDMLNKLKNFTIVGAAMRSFDWMFKWIASVVDSAFTWACDLATNGMLTRKILSSHSEPMLNWMMDIEKYNEDGALIKACWNLEDKMKFWKLFDLGQKFTKELAPKNTYLNTTIQRSMVKLQGLENRMLSLDVTAPARVDPFCIWIEGEPGVGKSAALATMITYLSEHMGWPKHNRVYSRNEGDEFWAGYLGQPVVLIDDICQIIKSEAVKDMIKMKSNVDYLLKMSESNEKGRRFTSQLIMCTSNSLYPQPQEMTLRSALWRRRNFLATAYVPDGQSKGDYTKLRFKMRIPNPRQPDCNSYFADLSFPQFLAASYEGLRSHIISQQAMIYSCLEGDTIFVAEDSGAEAREEALDGTFKMMAGWYTEHGLSDLPLHMKAAIMGFGYEDWNLFVKKYKIAATAYLRAQETWVKEEHWAQQMSTALNGAVPKKEVDLQADEENLIMNAETLLRERSGIARDFIHWERAYQRTQPVGKMVRYTNEAELKAAVARLHPEATNKDEILDRMKYIFQNHKATKEKPRFNTVKYLVDPQWRQYFSKKEDKWVCNLTEEKLTEVEDEAEVDRRFEVYEWWNEEVKDIAEWQPALETAFSGKADKKLLATSVRTLATWFKRLSDKCANFLDEHPRILSFMKISGAIAMMFGSYKVLKYLCGDWITQIEEKLKEYFGLVKSTKPVQYIIGKGNEGIVMGKDMVEKIRSMLSLKKDPVLMAVPEGEAVDLVAAELVKMLPAATAQASIRKRAAEPQYRAINAYTIGETIKQPVARPVVQRQQEVLTVATPKEEFLAAMQGSQDDVALNIRDAIRPNMARLSVVIEGKLRRLSGLFLKGRTLLCPLHFLERCVEGDILDIRCGELHARESFAPDRMKRISNLDAVLYECSMRMPFKRDIVKHFMTEQDYEMMGKTPATLHVLAECMDLNSWVTTATIGPGVRYKNQGQVHNYECTRAWEYEVGTRKGDCGGILLANNPNMARKIMGMHIAGIPDQDEGFALGISREEIDETMAFLTPVSRVKTPTVTPQCYIEEGAATKMIPEGNFTIYGKAKPKYVMKLAEKTEIRKSPIHGLVRAPVTEPAILTPKDPRWKWEDTPLVRGVAKYGHETIPFRSKDIEHVTEFLTNEIKKWKLVMEPRVITDHEAVFGNEMIPYFDRMNLASSPGYPFVLKRPAGEKGKAYLYDINQEDGIASEEYREMYREREEAAKKGERSLHVWCACLKDERRPIEKIEAGKTRVFVLGSADYTQLMRKYFMAFNVNFYANHVKFFSAVGIDPYSFTWTKLWKRLTRKGMMGFGADYKNFDGHVDPDMIHAFGKIVNNFYGPDEPEENKRVREVLIEDCIHSVILMYNVFLEKHVGNPSGCAETTPLNTVVNIGYLMLAWIIIMREKCPTILMLEYFRVYVIAAIYGDDGVVGVHPNVESLFNLKEVSRVLENHGITYTDESKGAELYTVKPLADCTFLKNGFKKMEGRGVMLAPIAENTIYELLNWVRASDDDVQQLRENILDVFKFAFHHGEPFYETLKREVNLALAKRNLRGFAASYAHQREEFLDACSY